MIVRIGLVCFAAVLIVGDLLAMLAGGSAWYAWVPVTLVTLSAVFAFIPRSRIAGLVAGVLWGIFAVIGIGHEKLFGPLGFAALSALVVAVSTSLSPAFARWSLVPIVFFEIAWLASLGRQVFFEEATLGRVTSTIDGCANYFMPLVFALFMVVVLAAAALIRFAPVLGTPAARAAAMPLADLGGAHGSEPS